MPAKSKAQQKAAGAALSARRGKAKPEALNGASRRLGTVWLADDRYAQPVSELLPDGQVFRAKQKRNPSLRQNPGNCKALAVGKLHFENRDFDLGRNRKLQGLIARAGSRRNRAVRLHDGLGEFHFKQRFILTSIIRA